MIEHPALLDLPRGVRLLHIEATVWSKFHQTDGHIPASSLRRITDEPDYQTAAAALVAAGLWAVTATGWTIVGFLDKQMSAERVRLKREDAKARYDRYQTGKRVSNATANATANDAAPPRPALPRPTKEGQAGGQDDDVVRRPDPSDGSVVVALGRDSSAVRPGQLREEQLMTNPEQEQQDRLAARRKLAAAV